MGGKGLFVKELETALESGAAHLAVHSLKDVPMELPAGFALVAVLEREDPRDAFVSNRFASLAELPAGRVGAGTSSLRRVAQLLALRPDLRVAARCAANLDTRLRKLDDGGYDAIVLAAAGLMRLGLGDRIRARFEAHEMIPAGGAGRARAGDSQRQRRASRPARFTDRRRRLARGARGARGGPHAGRQLQLAAGGVRHPGGGTDASRCAPRSATPQWAPRWRARSAARARGWRRAR